MSACTDVRVKRQFYLDSVALMRLSAELARADGVDEAAMMMATPANVEILRAADLLPSLPDDVAAGDLLVAVRGADRACVDAALETAERLLETPRRAGEARAHRPRTLAAAVQRLPGARLALISVPGAFAAGEARKAIRHGLHAMVFSDNVPLADEVALKREARALGRLVMGPDCGTAVIGGVPLAFANRWPRGDIGIVGASGTGIQEIGCLIARAGHGISHAIGVGGRDLGAEVGGLSTLAALDALERDAETRHVVLVSKPPAPDVASRVLERIGASGKTFTVCFVGGEPPALPANATAATTLEGAARHAAGRAPERTDAERATEGRASGGMRSDGGTERSGGGLLRGLFCGGTLCAEAQVVCRERGVGCTSNAPIPGAGGTLDDTGHTLVDLGADEYTRGRPHPMIEPGVRDAALAAALADPRSGALLLDVVIGLGAHADPAGRLLASLPVERAAPIFASVTGTDDDPQVRSRQVERLRAAGIDVAPSNAEASRRALARVTAGD